MARPRAPAGGPKAPMRAVRYLRMSTARQPQSLAHQAAIIDAYAQARSYEIVGSYEDAAISGVAAHKRPAFRALLALVLGGQADFEAILVYDVSRWGRFQDPDEAAHYEFLCGQEGVRITYCAEGFGDGQAPQASLMKSLKRAMAAEYSRELGAKVAGAQRRLAALGHWQHGPPGYGLRRRLVGADGTLGEILEDGQRKADPRQHTVLVAGPAREVTSLRRMHHLCGREGRTPTQIARLLNQEGVPAPRAKAWSGERVRALLVNSKYAGVLVTGKRHTPLGGRRQAVPAADWITAPGAAPALVSKQAFAATQRTLDRAAAPQTAELLETLKIVAQTHGVVGEGRLRALGIAHHRAYRARFGSLRAAFAAIGHAPGRRFPKAMDDASMLKGLARLFQRVGNLTPALINADSDIPCADHYRRRFKSLPAAYARIGFVRISAAEARSPLGQVRLTARRLRIAHWAES